MSVAAAFIVPHPPLIVPAVGRGGEKQIEKTTAAYLQVAEEIAALAPETIIITSPHATMYSDYFHISPGRSAEGSFARFGAPEVRFSENYDIALAERICALADAEGLPAPRRHPHCIARGVIQASQGARYPQAAVHHVILAQWLCINKACLFEFA